jgi:hypothetical protein
MSIDNESFPAISKALVDSLEERCPEKCPELTMTEKEIWFYAGQRQIVRLVKKAYEEQNETILSKE